MKYILVSYNNDPTWVKEYTDNWVIYDRSEVPFVFPNTQATENTGQVDFDKLCYLISNYDSLPDVFLLGKTNLFKSISKEEFDKVKDNKVFTPLVGKEHAAYSDDKGEVCYYKDGMYYERNDSWYVSQFQKGYFSEYKQFADAFGLPSPKYLPFAPGGNYILTKEVVHKYPREFYVKMINLLPYCKEPVEAQMCERSYFNMWK